MNETLSKEEARQGETSGHVRTVLRISTALAVVALIIVWIVAV